jgi:hypothetical protein
MQQGNNGPRIKGAATSKKREDNPQNLQEGSRAGDHGAKIRTFNQNSENDCQYIVEGSTLSEMKEETTHRAGAADVGAPATLGSLGAQATLGSFARTNREKDLYCLHPAVCHDVERKADVSTTGPTGTLCGNCLA